MTNEKRANIRLLIGCLTNTDTLSVCLCKCMNVELPIEYRVKCTLTRNISELYFTDISFKLFCVVIKAFMTQISVFLSKSYEINVFALWTGNVDCGVTR